MQQLGIQTSMDTMFVWKSTPVFFRRNKKENEKKKNNKKKREITDRIE